MTATVTTYEPPRIDSTPPIPQPRNIGNITTDAWWAMERRMMQQEFTDITMEILLAGAEAGVGAMPTGLDVLVDWDVFNQQALDWMGKYLTLDPRYMGDLGSGAYSWVTQLTDTTRKTVIGEINSWVREGAELKVLEERLKPTFGETRAQAVAVTEVTRIFAQGNITAWKASGVVTGKRWMTARDERVCPICGPMHNKLVSIDNSWQFTAEMLAANPTLASVLKQPTAIYAPPAHVRCRCWVQPVVLGAYDESEIEEQTFGR